MFFSNVDIGTGIFACAIAFALPAAFAALAQGRALDAAFSGIARQPEAANDIKGSLIIGLAFPEALGLFGWVLGGFILSALVRLQIGG